VDKIPILLTADWLLDRFRTTSNVLGDITVAVLLDRVAPPAQSPIETPESVYAKRNRGDRADPFPSFLKKDQGWPAPPGASAPHTGDPARSEKVTVIAPA